MTTLEMPELTVLPTANDAASTADNNDTAWADMAACRSVEDATHIFFGETNEDIAAAKTICSQCVVIAPCLEGALERKEAAGVWGGQLFQKGQVVTVRRRRGRPPKVARPEDDLPQVPVPAHLQRLIA